MDEIVVYSFIHIPRECLPAVAAAHRKVIVFGPLLDPQDLQKDQGGIN